MSELIEKGPRTDASCGHAGFLQIPIWICVCLLLLIVPETSRGQQDLITGYTTPHSHAKLGVSVTGRVSKINVLEGAEVKAGQIILELDQALEKLEVMRRKLLWESKAEVRSVERRVKTLESHLRQTQKLYESTGSVSREELENQELEHALALEELKRLEDAEKRQEIEYRIAEQQLSLRNLRAPFSGRIVELLVNVGENCESDTPLVYLADTSRGFFIANVELGASRKLTLGQAVELRLSNGPDTVSLDAKIVFISPVVDPASGLRKIKAEFQNRDGKIVPGVSGVMAISEDQP